MKKSVIHKTMNKRRRGRMSSWIIFLLLIYAIGVVKFVTWETLEHNLLLGLYSIAISFHVLSRFVLAYFYDPQQAAFDPHYEPTLSFGIPTKNEGMHIRETIMRIVQSDYPKSKFDIIVVNDGSTDNTLAEMQEAARLAALEGVTVKIIDWEHNKGKREGMAECIRQSRHDILVFIDSDSFVEPRTGRELAKYFFDPKIAAVAGHAYVANEETTLLAKMQAVHYYIAFKAFKAAEALFGTVTCCSGCCAAYRRTYVLEILDAWCAERFMGVSCTYGDDRSMTNALLEQGYACVFSPTAIVYTFVPETLPQLMRQQLRWKKSWTRECFRAGSFIWKRNPIMSASFYLDVILSLLAPFIIVRALLWYPYITGHGPWHFIIGLALTAIVYGLYYYLHTNDRKWVYGTCLAAFYSLILFWQLPYAILSLRDSRWGTR